MPHALHSHQFLCPLWALVFIQSPKAKRIPIEMLIRCLSHWLNFLKRKITWMHCAQFCEAQETILILIMNMLVLTHQQTFIQRTFASHLPRLSWHMQKPLGWFSRVDLTYQAKLISSKWQILGILDHRMAFNYKVNTSILPSSSIPNDNIYSLSTS